MQIDSSAALSFTPNRSRYHCVQTRHRSRLVSSTHAHVHAEPAAVVGGESYVIGVDYGTLSGRAVVVRVSDGVELGSAVLDYPHAVMDTTLAATGEALPPEWALQVPADYVAVLWSAVPAAMANAGIDPARVIGIGTDFTACTMVPVLFDGTPLNELPEYAGRPHAYVKLWRHHAAQAQADRINDLAFERNESWLPRYGGLISSEWEFAKGSPRPGPACPRAFTLLSATWTPTSQPPRRRPSIPVRWSRSWARAPAT